MRLFWCGRCSSVLFFENDTCRQCGATLGYDPEAGALRALEPSGDGWKVLDGGSAGATARLCRNAVDHGACNWLVTRDEDAPFCRSCRLDQMVPDLSDETSRQRWRRLEAAKRRLLYSLFALGLPTEPRGDHGTGLAFRFLCDTPGHKVVTGHADGVITLDVAEADAAFREHTREQLGEDYRTVLGHFRHEIGHYYWDRLVRDERLEAFRTLFGDERDDYSAAIERHYRDGPPAGWREHFLSAYATMHPWEDWAETWAHYLHMVDTLETAASYGLVVREPAPSGRGPSAASRDVDFGDFGSIVAAWYPLTLALNGLSRSMGKDDLYPFALSPESERKLAFVHDVVRGARGERDA